MRRLISLIVVIVIILAGIFAYGLVSRYTASQLEGNPVSRLARSMFAPATPVILPDPTTIIREVNQVARLETATFEGEKVITSSRDEDLLFGLFEESIVFVAYGRVTAGVDLEQMGPGDIQVVDPTTVMIHLPDPEILNAYLDDDKSYVADRDSGFLSTIDPNMETQVRRAGREAIRSAAEEFGILEEAEANAEEYMEGFLQGLGFETVIFTEDPPPTPPPFEPTVPKGRSLIEPAGTTAPAAVPTASPTP